MLKKENPWVLASEKKDKKMLEPGELGGGEHFPSPCPFHFLTSFCASELFF